MEALLPPLLLGLAAGALVLAVFLFSRSVAGLFGEATLDDVLPASLGDDQQTLLDEKHALLVALRDLDLERQHRKVSEKDYESLSTQYRARARGVLEELDSGIAPYRESAERRVREHLDSVRQEPDVEKRSRKNAEARRTPVEAATAEVVCASCQTKNDVDAAFCKKCGAKL